MSRKALPCKVCVEHPKGTCFAARSDFRRFFFTIQTLYSFVTMGMIMGLRRVVL